MNNDLIEKAAAAMRGTGQLGYRSPDPFKLAQAALTVFEEAHVPSVIERPDFVMPDPDAPTDDERETLAQEWSDREFPETPLAPENERLADAAYEGFCAGYDADFRHPVPPESSERAKAGERIAVCPDVGTGFRLRPAEPQDEPTETPEIGMPCANTETHPTHAWQMSATGWCLCSGVQAEPTDHAAEPQREPYDTLYALTKKAIGNEDYGPQAWHLVARDISEWLKSQREPSDEQVVAGLHAFFETTGEDSFADTRTVSEWGVWAGRMRAALSAAARTGENEGEVRG